MEEEGQQSLELLEKKPIKKGLGFYYIGCSGHAMWEYHLDSLTKLEDDVDEANCMFGGNLSIPFPGQNLKDGTYSMRMQQEMMCARSCSSARMSPSSIIFFLVQEVAWAVWRTPDPAKG
jgi:hypothetical protein